MTLDEAVQYASGRCSLVADAPGGKAGDDKALEGDRPAVGARPARRRGIASIIRIPPEARADVPLSRLRLRTPARAQIKWIPY